VGHEVPRIFGVGAADGLEHGTAVLEIEQTVKTAKSAVVVGSGLAALIALWVKKRVDVDETRVAVAKLDGRLGAFCVDEVHVVATASVTLAVETHFHSHERSVKTRVFLHIRGKSCTKLVGGQGVYVI
jgi:hypothetical protein